MFKVKALFSEYWFKTKDGRMCYKIHFNIDEQRTAFVPAFHKYDANQEVMLKVGRDNEGRAKLQVVEN